MKAVKAVKAWVSRQAPTVFDQLAVVDRDAPAERVHGSFDHLIVDGCMAEKGPVVDKGPEKVEQELAVDVAVQVAASDAAGEYGVDRLAQWLEERGHEGLGELWMACTVSVQGADDIGGYPPEGVCEQHETIVEVAERAAGVWHSHLAQAVSERSEHEAFARPPAPIDRRLARAGAASDVLEREVTIPHCVERLDCGVEYRCVDVGVPGVSLRSTPG